MKKQSSLASKYAMIISWLLSLLGLYLTSLYSYLLFHSLSEIFSIVVSCGIFTLAWNSRHITDNSYVLFIGIAYLFVSGLDLLHTLVYPGMGIFRVSDTNLAAQLWISARYVESLSLLLSLLFTDRKPKVCLVFASFFAIFFLLLTMIFHWKIFPVCFAEGSGLTLFKKISEYVISVILLGTVFLLLQKRKNFDPDMFRLLISSVALTIASELAFTFYIHAYGLFNLIGHYLKIISFYLIYKAIIETGLVKPYSFLFRNLKQSEESLREQRDFAEALVETAQAIVLVLDTEGRIIRFNAYMEELSGYKLEEVQGKEWFTAFLPEHEQNLMRELFSGAIHDIRTRGRVHSILTKNGCERHIEWHDKTLKDRHCNIVGLVAVGHDITEKLFAEDSLRESEERFRSTFEEAPVGIAHTDPDGRFIKVNKGLCNIFGCTTREEMLNLSFQDITHPDDLENDSEQFRQILENKIQTYSIQKRYIREDSSYVWANLTVSLVRELSGKPKYFISIVEDISEKVRSEEALRKSEERLREAQTAARMGSYEIDVRSRQITWSDQLFRLFDRDISLGPPTYEENMTYYYPEDSERFQAGMKCAIEHGKQSELDLKVRLPRGKSAYHRGIIKPAKDDTGRVVRLIGTAQDITFRKNYENNLKKLSEELRTANIRLQEADRLKSIFLSA